MLVIRYAGILFFFFLFSCNQKREIKAKQLVDEAIKIKDRDTVKALQYLDKAISFDSALLVAHVLKADILKAREQYAEALIEYRKAQTIDRVNVAALFGMGLTYDLLDRADSSILCYTKAINIKGGDSGAYIDFTSLPAELRGYDTDVKMADLRYFRGKVFYYSNQLKAALRDFYFCVQSNYEVGKSALYVGVIYCNFDDYTKGCKYLQISLKAGNPDAQKYLDQYCKK